MTPIDIACRHQNDDLTNCSAEAGEYCNWPANSVAMMYGLFHAERIEDAAAMTTGEGRIATIKQFDDAIDKTGLV